MFFLEKRMENKVYCDGEKKSSGLEKWQERVRLVHVYLLFVHTKQSSSLSFHCSQHHLVLCIARFIADLCVYVCVCVCVCQRKTKDRADGMREKSAHCPRRDSNLFLWDTRPSCFQLHHDGRHASHQSKQTLQTLTRQLDRETIMHETLQLLSVCACMRVCVCVFDVYRV